MIADEVGSTELCRCQHIGELFTAKFTGIVDVVNFSTAIDQLRIRYEQAAQPIRQFMLTVGDVGEIQSSSWLRLIEFVHSARESGVAVTIRGAPQRLQDLVVVHSINAHVYPDEVAAQDWPTRHEQVAADDDQMRNESFAQNRQATPVANPPVTEKPETGSFPHATHDPTPKECVAAVSGVSTPNVIKPSGEGFDDQSTVPDTLTSPIATVKRQRRMKLFVALSMIAAIAILVIPRDSALHGTLNACDQCLEEIVELRRSASTRADWDDFRQRAAERLNPLLVKLSSRGNARTQPELEALNSIRKLLKMIESQDEDEIAKLEREVRAGLRRAGENE